MAILILLAIAVCVAIISFALMRMDEEIFYSYETPQWFDTLINAATIALPISITAAALLVTIGVFALIAGLIA